MAIANRAEFVRAHAVSCGWIGGALRCNLFEYETQLRRDGSILFDIVAAVGLAIVERFEEAS
jgi:hypothetical protein